MNERIDKHSTRGPDLFWEIRKYFPEEVLGEQNPKCKEGINWKNRGDGEERKAF